VAKTGFRRLGSGAGSTIGDGGIILCNETKEGKDAWEMLMKEILKLPLRCSSYVTPLDRRNTRQGGTYRVVQPPDKRSKVIGPTEGTVGNMLLSLSFYARHVTASTALHPSSFTYSFAEILLTVAACDVNRLNSKRV
jgi:hypothetical protein